MYSLKVPTRSSLEDTKHPKSGWITVQGSSQGKFISRSSGVEGPNEIAEANVTNVEVENSETVRELGEGSTLMTVANSLMEVPVITDVRSLSPDSQIKISLPVRNARNIVVQTVTQDAPQLMNSPGKGYASEKEILPTDTSSSPEVEKADEDLCVNKYRICRLCLRYVREILTPLFCGDRAKPYLVCFLKECCSLEVIQDDPMPKWICENCRNKLIRAYDFRNQCHKSDKILRKYYKLPPKNDFSQADECVIEKEDKAIQVECFDHSERIVALRSLETMNIEDENSADDLRAMDIVGKINHVNVGIDEDSVSHFYESLAQEVNSSIENTDGEPPGEAEVDFESLETQEPHFGEVNDVNIDMDENSVSNFYEFLDQEVSKDIENSEDNTRGEAEVEFECFVEQEPHLVKTNDVNEDIDENSVSLFYEPFDPEVSNDIENPEDNRPREVQVEFESFKEQEPHQEEKSKKLNFFLCKMCPSGFKTKDLLEKHTDFHLTKKTYTCDTCSKVFKIKGSLTRHLKVHEETKKFKCDVCELTLRHKYQLDSHLRLHGRGKPRQTEKKFFCEVCDKSFAYKGGLKQHEKLHTDVRHKCRFCDKTFPTEAYRRKHELRHGEKRFKCHLCSSIYASDNGLKLHILRHTGEAHYPCDICGKKFSRSRNLNEHINTHTGKKPYICKMCGVAYGNAGSLFAHERRCKLSVNDELA